MADIFEIAGRIHSTSQEEVVTVADEILDTAKNKKQDEINTETYSLVNDINERLSGLNPEQQSALSVAAKATNNETKLGYYVCGTEGNVAAKVISDATGYVLSTGGSIKVKMTNANTANNVTLNINSTGAKPLYYDGERASANNTWEAGETVEVYYDGTNFYANNVAGSGGDGVFDVSEKYPTSGVEGGNTYTLDGALAVLNANLPASKKKGGMSIKFVQSSDNKYVQYRLKSNTFSTDTEDWEDESTEVQFRVMVEALTYLYNENKALHELLTGKDNAVLPYIKAQTIECVDKMTMGVPDVLESNVAGAPSAANVPDNWNEATMNVWDGCPRRIGQQYVDKASGKVYYAIKVTGSTDNWVALN